ncbi:FUSC family protein [Arthrobacter deserti]|uniref:FUSC family protein n=1 Tax=Arthrobacter deserti TaxID=1742687 RepID=A0ABX1JSG9_9MICC|nr:FUSC family protein [Arthrobacter deserti]
MTAGTRLSDARAFARKRIRVGLRRSRNSVGPALRIVFCAVAAYTAAERLLGHQGPIFAATSALIALGFGKGPRLRKVLEVAVGCTLGIADGDLLVHLLGAGIWQAGVVMFISVLLARFLDSGAIFTTQLALQSVLVVLLPAPAGGPFTRSIDAVVGGCFALLVTMLAPGDPRTEPRVKMRSLLSELTAVLRGCSAALSQNDATAAWHALVRARASQSLIDDVRSSFTSAREVARIAPAYRRHHEEVADLHRAAGYIGLAMRNSRVFSRRLTSVTNPAAISDEASDSLATLLQEAADGVEMHAAGLADPDPGARERRVRSARNEFADVATRLHPKTLGTQTLEGEGLVVVFRPLMVDLLEATGLSHEEAAGYLPRL